MAVDKLQNYNSQTGELVQSISLVDLLENPDPDFDVVVERRSRDMRGWIKRAADAIRPARSTPKAGSPGDNAP